MLKYDKMRKIEGEDRLISKETRHMYKQIKTIKSVEKIAIKKKGEIV